MYRLIVESLLGLKLEGSILHVAPCLPADWKELTIHYRYRETLYHITVPVSAENGETRVMVDGVEHPDAVIPLVDDGQERLVQVKCKP